jgi:tetratricopeptide (TPR) repeat protein
MPNDDDNGAEPAVPANGEFAPRLDPALDDTFGFSADDWGSRAGRAIRPAVSLGSLGGYKLLEELGRGGQGSVYKAVQPGTGRLVAIKRLGSAVLLGDRQNDRFRERYRAEIDALTRLQHPSIVTVHAAEVIDGHPVLVMEFIDGGPIDRWADRQWAQVREPARAILECFLQVCAGVSHAHQRGVIHRDLKPSNILVARAPGEPPEVKVLDFGIARLISGWHQAGISTFTGFAGTPAYASPEQLAGRRQEPDTRSDVFSLGVLLGRLLGGREPCDPDASIAEVLESIRRAPLRRPSRHRPGLARELDLIVLKATQTEPQSRYQSVDALADDLRRFLDGRPIAAHPPGRAYLVGKFVRRHRTTCAVGALAGAAIITLAAVSSTQAVRLSNKGRALAAALNAEQAERERQRQTSDFLLGVVEKVASHSDGRMTIPIEHLAEWVEGPLEDATTAIDPEVLARLHLGVGTLYAGAGSFPDAIAHEQRAADLLTHPEQTELRLRAMLKVSSRQTNRGTPSPALSSANELMEEVERAGLARTPLGIDALRRLATAQARSGRRGEAIATLERALAIADETGQPAEFRALVLSDLAQRYLDDRQYGQAAEFALAALACIPADLQPATDACWRAWVLLGMIRFHESRVAEAERFFALASESQIRALGDGHIRTRNAMRWHARALHELGRFDEAARILERLLQLVPPDYESVDIGTWQTRFRYGATLLGQGRTQEARRQLRLAISRGGSRKSGDPEQELDLATQSLRATGLHFTPELRDRLADLAWLVDQTSDRQHADADDDTPEAPQ